MRRIRNAQLSFERGGSDRRRGRGGGTGCRRETRIDLIATKLSAILQTTVKILSGKFPFQAKKSNWSTGREHRSGGGRLTKSQGRGRPKIVRKGEKGLKTLDSFGRDVTTITKQGKPAWHSGLEGTTHDGEGTAAGKNGLRAT